MKRVYCDFCDEQIFGTFISSFGADYHQKCWDEREENRRLLREKLDNA